MEIYECHTVEKNACREGTFFPQTGRIRVITAGTLVMGLVALIFAGMAAQSDAMGTCQQTHSFDTCFSTLNR